MNQEPITIFGGTGFIGGCFYNKHRDAIIQKRGETIPATKNIIDFISTTDNYNIYNDPYLDIETNLLNLIAILDAAKTKYGRDFTFTFASSWFVYGSTGPVATEESLCNPTGFYSATKLCAERLLKTYCETFGIRYQILRFANVIGIDDKKMSLQKNAFQFLLKEIVQNRDVGIYRVPSFRDFIDVRDLVYGIDVCMDYGKWNEIYNIGNGKSHNVKDLLFYVRNMSKSTSKITEIETPDFHKLVQVQSFMMSNSKIHKLGYVPRFTIWDTIDELISYYKKN